MKAGIYYDMPESEYHADPCEKPSLSSSIAKLMLHSSPMHAKAKHPRLNPHAKAQTRTDFDLGTFAHKLWLEDDKGSLAVYPEEGRKAWNTNAAKDFREAAYAKGKTPLLQHQYEKVCAAVSVLSERYLLLDGDPEVTLIWQEPCGIWCRIRIDWLYKSMEIMDDLKTTANASPDAFSRTVWNLHYDVQNGLYRRGLKALESVDARFRWVAAELEAPFGVCEFELDAAGLTLADAKAEHVIQRWAWCLKNDEWPGYPDYAVAVEPPAWEMARWEMEL